MNSLKLASLSVLILLVQACGTTSKIQPSNDQGKAFSASQYQCLEVGNFDETVSTSVKLRGQTSEIHKQKLAALQSEALEVGEQFALILLKHISENGAFNEVTRVSDTKTQCLLIDGDVTGYSRSNVAARFLIPVIGSSKFDAQIRIKDKASDVLLGEVIVDKNSWPLGGALAATQGIAGHMRAAAKKVSKELVSATQNEE